METVSVVAAVVQRNGHYLICRRPAGKRHGGLWEFPGGKLQNGESLEDGIRRELAEELRVSPVRIGQMRGEIPDPDSQFVVTFVDVEIAGNPVSTEHEAIAWVAARDLPRYPLAPSDRLFATHLMAIP